MGGDGISAVAEVVGSVLSPARTDCECWPGG